MSAPDKDNDISNSDVEMNSIAVPNKQHHASNGRNGESRVTVAGVQSPDSESERRDREEAEEEPDYSLPGQLKQAIMGSKINALYVFVPISIASGFLGWAPGITFFTTFLALIPLAAALGDFTEDISLRTNEATAALINVTFGNATELIISVMALRKGMYGLIKYSLVGSILGNMLLVMGTSFLMAGIKHPSVQFNVAATHDYLSTLLYSVFGFLVATTFKTMDGATDAHSLRTSVWMSFVMVAMYAVYLWFQQKTHRSMFDGSGEDDEEDETPQYTFWFCFFAIGVVAVLISLLSDFLVDTVDGAAEEFGLSTHFLQFVLIPIVGNVAEHASAILLAMKGKVDIAVGVAFGSCVQIGLFVMPLLVILSAIINPGLDMVFTPFTIACLVSGVVFSFMVCAAGTTTYMGGLKMTSAYVLMSIAWANAP